uniref:Uncharacterized protein n=1 Tax=Anopheles dirus TaxID=7168 RepID=A0A182NYR3_9DIPT
IYFVCFFVYRSSDWQRLDIFFAHYFHDWRNIAICVVLLGCHAVL